MPTESAGRVKNAANREKILTIRAELPAIHDRLYLNNGTNGPLPQRTHDALVAAATAELHEGRIEMATWSRAGANAGAVRAKFAAILGCSPDEVALTHNTEHRPLRDQLGAWR